MPRGDGTGPMGLGPMTGRAAGYCAGYPVAGFANPGFAGRAMGMGRGFFGRGGGRGWRHWYWATGLPRWARGYAGAPLAGAFYPGAPAAPSAADELDMLKRQSDVLARELDAVRERMAELEREAQSD